MTETQVRAQTDDAVPAWNDDDHGLDQTSMEVIGPLPFDYDERLREVVLLWRQADRHREDAGLSLRRSVQDFHQLGCLLQATNDQLTPHTGQWTRFLRDAKLPRTTAWRWMDYYKKFPTPELLEVALMERFADKRGAASMKGLLQRLPDEHDPPPLPKQLPAQRTDQDSAEETSEKAPKRQTVAELAQQVEIAHLQVELAREREAHQRATDMIRQTVVDERVEQPNGVGEPEPVERHLALKTAVQVALTVTERVADVIGREPIDLMDAAAAVAVILNAVSFEDRVAAATDALDLVMGAAWHDPVVETIAGVQGLEHIDALLVAIQARQAGTAEVFANSKTRRESRRRKELWIDDRLTRAIEAVGLALQPGDPSLEIEDKRSSGGALWMVGEPEQLESLIKGPVAEFGPWEFSRTKKRAGYWTKWQADRAPLEL